MFDLPAEHAGDAKRRFERRRVLALFNGVHGLASQLDSIGQFLLRHFSVLEAQPPDFIANLGHVTHHADIAGSDSRNAAVPPSPE